MLEGERALVLVAGVSAILVLAGRRPVSTLVVGAFAAIVAISTYALAERLFPDHFSGYPPADYRLSGPIGYWNGLGVFTAMGVFLAVGVITRSPLRWLRVAAAVSLVALLPTLYYTFSRASWLALGLGLVALLALDPRRVQLTVWLLALMPLPGVAVLLSSRPDSLTKSGSSLAHAAHDGHRLAVVLLVVAVAQAGVLLLLELAASRARPPRGVRVAYVASLVACVVVAVAVGIVHEGNPVTAVQHAYDSFTAPTSDEPANLNSRLFTLSSNGRWAIWTVAWHQAEAHPLLGGGAGTFGQYWMQHRPIDIDLVDAHSLYLETLAELGPLGLALVLAFLAIPAAAAVRNRRHPLVPAVGGCARRLHRGSGSRLGLGARRRHPRRDPRRGGGRARRPRELRAAAQGRPLDPCRLACARRRARGGVRLRADRKRGHRQEPIGRHRRRLADLCRLRSAGDPVGPLVVGRLAGAR